MPATPQKSTRARHTIHRSGSTSHKSCSAGIFTFTPVKTRRGKTTYQDVPTSIYYRASSSEDEVTPRRKKIKNPGGGAGPSNMALEFAQFLMMTVVKTKGFLQLDGKQRSMTSFFSPSENSNPIKDSE
jgi:hypothetical protein